MLTDFDVKNIELLEPNVVGFLKVELQEEGLMNLACPHLWMLP